MCQKTTKFPSAAETTVEMDASNAEARGSSGFKKTVKKIKPICVAVILCCLPGIGFHYLSILAVHNRPKFDPKFNIASSCISRINKQVVRFMLEKYQHENYHPLDSQAASALQDKIDSLLMFKKKHEAIKDELYNFDPDLLLPLVVVVYYALAVLKSRKIVHNDRDISTCLTLLLFLVLTSCFLAVEFRCHSYF